MERVLAWRGSGKGREALVRWLGGKPDGTPWDDTWEPRRLLTSDLRAEGAQRRRRAQEPEGGGAQRQRTAESEAEKRSAEHEVVRRKTPRIAGVAPESGLR